MESETPRKQATRARIVDAAAELFYAEGIHEVPIERVIERADVTRSTLYRYFRTKEDLVVAWLEAEDARIRALYVAGAAPPEQILGHALQQLATEICDVRLRGCPFINASVEYPDPAHPVRRAVQAHRRWFESTLHHLLVAAGHPEPARAARALVMLRDGAMMGGYLDGPATVADALKWAGAAIAGPSPRG